MGTDDLLAAFPDSTTTIGIIMICIQYSLSELVVVDFQYQEILKSVV